jgi:hypothetical protein
MLLIFSVKTPGKTSQWRELRRVSEQIAENAHSAAQRLEMSVGWAKVLGLDDRLKDISFIGTPYGVIAIEKRSGALALAIASVDTFEKMKRTETEAGDPMVRAAIGEPALGASFIQKMSEQDCPIREPPVSALRYSPRIPPLRVISSSQAIEAWKWR